MKIISSEDYLEYAEKVIEWLFERKDPKGRQVKIVTTSKIRNILAMTSDIYNDVMLLRDNSLTDNVRDRISHLRIRCMYEAGRDGAVRDFVERSKLLDILPSVENRKDYITFSHYMEALVAWHRYKGGKDE